MPSLVSHIRTHDATSKQDILLRVKRAMELAQWDKHVTGKKIFIKPNLLSDQLVPGQCTSPWVVEGVIQTILDKKPDAKLVMGDTDVATARQVERAARVWGIRDLCDTYKIPFVNLSKDDTVPVEVNGHVCSHIDIPKSIHDSDSMITLPVAKTHNVTVMTGALKNQWGCIPRFRHQYHPVTEWVIPEINKAVSPDFVLADATISMEHAGPRVGIPEVTHSLFASADLVAMDTALARFMGIDPYTVKYIANAERLGLGTMTHTYFGDPVPQHTFKPARLESTPIVYLEMQFRKIPGLKWLLFDTPLFHIPAWIAAHYNSHYWYYTKGRKYARNIIKDHPLFRQEFEELMARVQK